MILNSILINVVLYLFEEKNVIYHPYICDSVVLERKQFINDLGICFECKLYIDDHKNK